MTASPTKSQLIRVARAEDKPAVLASMSLAFAADPLARWAFAGPLEYFKYYPRFLMGLCGAAFEHQSVHLLNDFAGAAFWLPPGVSSSEVELAAIFEESVTTRQLPRVLELAGQMAKFHPHEPHWYLAEIGIDPAHQRKGYGGALLEYGLERVDETHLPAFLESSNPANVSLYERYGFKALGVINVDSAPTVTPMLRDAQGPV